MSNRIRQRMSGDRRRSSLENLVRTRIAGGARLAQTNGPILAAWERQLSVVGPLNDDASVSGFDREWVYRDTGTFSISAPHMWAVAPTDDDITAWRAVYGARPPHEIRMRPMRWRIGADRDRVNPSPGVLLKEYGGGIAEEQRFFSLFETPWVPGDATTPPADSALEITSSTISFRPPFWEPGTTNNGSRVAFARVLVNGSDVTGIISVNSSATFLVRSIGSYYPIGRAGAFFSAISLTLPAPIPKAATIEIDLWYVLSLSRSDIEGTWAEVVLVYGTTAWPGSVSEGGAGSIGPQSRSHTLKGTADMNASRSARGNYLFQFTDQSVAGDTSLTTNKSTWTKGDDRWTLFDSATQHTFTFIFGVETPYIIIRKPRVGSAGFIEAKYMCSGSSYDPVRLYFGASPQDCNVGSFDPDGSNLFFSVTNSVTHESYNVASYAQFPSSITVSRP